MSRPISLTVRKHDIAIDAPYNATFVAELKDTIKWDERAWVRPHWYVRNTSGNLSTIMDLVRMHYNTHAHVVDKSRDPIETEEQFFMIEYVGRCKDSNIYSSDKVANAWNNDAWSVLFTETALREFFQPTLSSGHSVDDGNHYTTLGASDTDDQDTIKSKFKRLAKVWHPDLNQGDPDATEMFKKINEAYQVLSDPAQRRYYDFVLSVTETVDVEITHSLKSDMDDRYGYRAPLKCGYVMAEGITVMGKFIVTRISQWEDIIEDDKMMIVHWPNGATKFEVRWV